MVGRRYLLEKLSISEVWELGVSFFMFMMIPGIEWSGGMERKAFHFQFGFEILNRWLVRATFCVLTSLVRFYLV